MATYIIGYDYFKKPYIPPKMGRTQEEDDRLENLIKAAEQVNLTLDVLPEDIQSEYDSQYMQLVDAIEKLKNKI
jgi:hypothetical protein